jgi:hypothetical protein
MQASASAAWRFLIELPSPFYWEGFADEAFGRRPCDYFFGGRGDPLKKRILSHHAPPSFPTALLPGQQSAFSSCKEPWNRVNVAFLHIVGGVYQRYARSAIILIIVRGMSRPRRSVFTPKRR